MAKAKALEVRYAAFLTPWGWCAAAKTERGLCEFALPVSRQEDAEKGILARRPGARRDPGAFADLATAVEKYFNGWTVSFDLFPIDLWGASSFRERVWSLTRRIRYGQVRSYRWISLEIGRPGAARGIGAALGANPMPLIVPCHRVVASDGTLRGFSAEGGLDTKARMLELEGVRIVGEGDGRKVVAK